ncbi:MAG: RsmB/NOP family class I SAM-dependent RNA methyltransferase [Alphaproteobacteria bacterium]
MTKPKPGKPARANPRTKKNPVGLPARRAAVDVLHKVLRQGETLDAALGASLDKGLLKPLAHRDRALARLIVTTSLRRLPQIEAVLAKLMSRKLGARAGTAPEILITGAAQILFLETSPHAAVDLANWLASYDRAAKHFKPLVNAVLRRLAGESKALLKGENPGRQNLPGWLWERWQAAYGRENAHAIANMLLDDPPLDLTVKSDAEGWAARLGGMALANGSVRLVRAGKVSKLEGFGEGAWWVQDASAAVAARLFGDMRGQSVVDLCAAPGGKTAQLAASGAQVTAVDADAKRMERLAQNLSRLGLSASQITADAHTWRPKVLADKVLLDAPCSATGIARRHPDILRRRRPSQLAPLVELQGELLAAATQMVKKGGQIIYCTCSLEPEEGEAQITKALATAPLARMAITAPEVPGFEASLTAEGDLQILPNHLAAAPPTPQGSDGFFIARLVKT